jgi:hypothetical protein
VIPVSVPTGTAARWNVVYDVIGQTFDTLGVALFRDTYFGYFALLVLLIGISGFFWRWFKGV